MQAEAQQMSLNFLRNSGQSTYYLSGKVAKSREKNF
jgi:hypothetical protein